MDFENPYRHVFFCSALLRRIKKEADLAQTSIARTTRSGVHHLWLI